MPKSLSDKYLTAIFWAFADKLGTGGFNFLITIILARLLVPEDFGLIAMVMIFYEIAYTFVESGFTDALVREKEISEADKSTTFVFNFISALVLYAILFCSAPFIARFFEHDILTGIIRILGLNLIIESFSIIQGAMLIQRIDFKTLAKTRLAAIFISAIFAIILALKGFGVWSIVVKYGVSSLVSTIALTLITHWKPRIHFSRESFNRLFGFGSKIFLRAMIDKIYLHIYNLIIGKYFSASMLGFYSQAAHLKNTVILTLFQTVHKVTYPVLAKLQDDFTRLKDGYRKVLKMNSFVIFPIMVIMVVLAKPIIVTLIGLKWLPAVPFLQLLCLASLPHHFTQTNINMLLVVGRPDLSLKLEIVQKVVITIGISIGILFGIYGLVISQVVSAYIGMVINSLYSKKLLDYGLLEQVSDVLPSLFFTAIMAGVLLLMGQLLPYTGLMQLATSLPVALGLYLGLHFFTNSEEMKFVSKTIIPQTLKLLKLSRS
jgi:O-antigen/teichoic acid export membrane protein